MVTRRATKNSASKATSKKATLTLFVESDSDEESIDSCHSGRKQSRVATKAKRKDKYEMGRKSSRSGEEDKDDEHSDRGDYDDQSSRAPDDQQTEARYGQENPPLMNCTMVRALGGSEVSGLSKDPSLASSLLLQSKRAVKNAVKNNIFKKVKVITEPAQLDTDGEIAEYVFEEMGPYTRGWTMKEKQDWWDKDRRGETVAAISRRRANVSNSIKAKFMGKEMIS